MADYSKMSDAELMALVQGSQPAQDYSKMSDADLLKVVKPERGVIDKLTGRDGGERYQTWPEKLVRGIASSATSAATLPGDVMAGRDSPENTGRVLELATMGTPVNPGIRAGDTMIPGVAKAIAEKPPVVPTTQELARAGAADIKAAQGSDLVINAAAVADQSRKLQQELFNSGIHPTRATDTYAILKELENAPAGSTFTPANLQTLRESLGSVAQNFNPNASKDQLAASRAIKGLDDFLRGLNPKDTVAGPASAAPATREQLIAQAMGGKREADSVANLFERGRGNYAAAMRSNDITGVLDRARTGILERAEARSQAAHSGRNIDNTLRQKTEAVLEKPKEISGYSDAELAALQGVVEGGTGRNLARSIGNKLGGGGGAAQTILAGAGAGAGAAMGGIPGAFIGAAVPAGIGSGARAIANALAKRDMRGVDELLRKRSPLYEERLANPETYVISPDKRAAIARAMMMQAFQDQQ